MDLCCAILLDLVFSQSQNLSDSTYLSLPCVIHAFCRLPLATPHLPSRSPSTITGQLQCPQCFERRFILVCFWGLLVHR